MAQYRNLLGAPTGNAFGTLTTLLGASRGAWTPCIALALVVTAEAVADRCRQLHHDRLYFRSLSPCYDPALDHGLDRWH